MKAKSIRIDAYEKPRNKRERVKTQERGERIVKEKKRDSNDAISETMKDLGIRPFTKEYRRLRKLAGADDFSSSKAAYALLKAQLSMGVQAMPVLEANLHHYKNDRAAYALVSLSNHMREIAHDLRSFGDQTELTDRIRDVVLQTVFRSLAAEIVQDVMRTRQDLVSELKSPNFTRVVEKRMKALQERLASSFVKAESESFAALQRMMNLKK